MLKKMCPAPSLAANSGFPPAGIVATTASLSGSMTLMSWLAPLKV